MKIGVAVAVYPALASNEAQEATSALLSPVIVVKTGFVAQNRLSRVYVHSRSASSAESRRGS